MGAVLSQLEGVLLGCAHLIFVYFRMSKPVELDPYHHAYALHVLGRTALFVILRLKTKLGLKRPCWVMKRWCTLTALMDQNGSVAMVVRNAITCPASLVTQNNRWKQGGGYSYAHSISAENNKRKAFQAGHLTSGRSSWVTKWVTLLTCFSVLK